MYSTHGLRLPVQRTFPDWNIAVGFDLRQFIFALGEATINASTGNLASAVNKLLGAATHIHGVQDPAAIAWQLVAKALARTISGIVTPSHGGLLERRAEDFAALANVMETNLRDLVVSIGADFFKTPSDLPVIEASVDPLFSWLKQYRNASESKQQLRDRVRLHFSEHLHDEWLSNVHRYKPLLEVFDSPFRDSIEREQQWSRYSEWLFDQYDVSSLDQAAPLSQCYVALRGYYEVAEKRRKETQRHVIEVGDEILKWLKSSKAPAMQVICGELGAGKTSTAKRLAVLATNETAYRPVFIPLVTFIFAGTLRESVNEYLETNNFLQHGPLDFLDSVRPVLLIFDGLEDLKDETPDNFVDNVSQACDAFNRYEECLRVLITGRASMIASLSRRKRFGIPTIYLLPHFVPLEERKAFTDPSCLLSEDRRRQWCKQYTIATGRNLTSFEAWIHSDANLSAISAHPLLLHLLAITGEPAGKDDTESGHLPDLNSVYNDLLRAVYDRQWAIGQSRDRHLSFDSFCSVFEAVAVTMWQKTKSACGLATLRAGVLAQGIPGIRELVNTDDSFRDLLSTFYLFERSAASNEGEPLYEWGHRSFGEFLAAKAIIRSIEQISTTAGNKNDDSCGGIHHRQRWFELFRQEPLRRDHVSFLISEMRRRDPDVKIRWFNCLTAFLRQTIETGISVKSDDLVSDFHTLAMHVRNCDELCLAAAHASARASNRLVNVGFRDRAAFGRWLAWITGQRVGRENPVALDCLGMLDLDASDCLFGRDLLQSNFSRSVLSGVKLRWACLRDAKLIEAKLDGGADLRDCDLQGADLTSADLSRALLQGANLRWATLDGCNLKDADLEGADLRGASMRGALCRGANFLEADLRDLDCPYEEVVDLNLEGAVTRSGKDDWA